MTAASLAGQAVVALENARLHRMVERQALVDGLTGLANRRQADEALASEIARSERLGGHVGLILAASTTSRPSTTASATRPATSCSATSRGRCARTCARSTPPRDGAARSSRSSSRAPTSRVRPRWPSGSRIALAEREILSVDGAPLHVTASFSVAMSGRATVQQLVEAADEALYRAKRAGKDRVYAGTDPVTRL